MVGRESFPGGVIPQAQSGRIAPAARERGVLSAFWRDPLPFLLIPAILIVGLWHLDRYPQTWFDEGMYLQVAKNFAGEGLYAVRSADGTIDYAPIIGVGPTVLMPAALALRIGGNELAVARLIPLLALLVASLLVYLIARGLVGRLAAACTLLLLFAMPALDWLATGRQLLGEVPAIGLLLAGGAIAWRAPTRLGAVSGGILLGLTMVTKGQYLLILPLALGAIGLFDLIVTRRRSFTWYVLLGVSVVATYVGWFVLLLSLLDEGQIGANFQQLRASSGGALMIIDRGRMLAGASLLLGPRTFLLAVPATVYGLWLIWRAEGERRLGLVALWVFQTLWLLWFTFASIAWPRYAFPALVINVIFMGALVTQLGEATRQALVRREWQPRTIAQALLLIAIALLVARGAFLAAAPVVRADQRDPQAFAREVERVVPPDAVIDSWEPELGFLVDRSIQYPPLGSLDRVVRAQWLSAGAAQATSLDLGQSLRGDYLIIGPFARWVGVYNSAATSTRYRLVARVGNYELYRREGSAAQAAPGMGAP